MAKRLEVIIKILIGLTFFVPLLVVPSSFIFPFIVPKILLFRGLVLLMLGTYVLLLASNWQKYKIRLTGLNLAVGLFFIGLTVSTFTGVDWYKSFWDNHERMLGLFTLLHYFIYYLIITSLIKEWSDWRNLLRLFLLAGGLVMFIGLMQKVNPELLLNRGSGRVSSTLGNAIYYSGYGLFLFFIGLFLAIKERKQNLSLFRQGFWFWYAVAGSVLGFLGIFWGGTRGTMLGLIAALAVLLLGYLISLKGHKRTQRIIGGGLAIAIIILGLLFAFRQNQSVQRIPGLGRLLNTSIIADDTTSTRFMAWKIAIQAWQEKPVFGWGPNNYYYAYNKYYNPKFLEHGWGETWFDNAHSALFNTIAVQGVAGLLFYLGLFMAPVWYLWRGYKKGMVDAHLLSIGTAFLVGHFIHNAVVFENPTSYLYFFFFLAFINQLTNNRHQITENKKQENKISFGLSAVVGVAILLLIYLTNVNPARANVAAFRMLGAVQAGQNPVEAYKKAASISSPHIDDIRSDFVRGLVVVLPAYVQANRLAIAEELYDVGYEESKKNLSLHPLDIRTHLQLAQLFQQGIITLKKPSALLSEAESILQEALKISPKRQQIYYTLSFVKMQMHKTAEAIALLEQSIKDDSKVGEGWWRLALVYNEIGQIEKAKEVLKQAEERGAVLDARGEEIKELILAINSTATDTSQ